MPDNQNPGRLSNRKITNSIVKWYFENHQDIEKIADKRSGPKFSDQQWAELLVEAISSFNRGLETLEPDNRRASIKSSDVVDLVGPDAFNMVAFLVAAQGRPIDTWAQASTIYTGAMSLVSNPTPQTQKQLHDAMLQLQALSKTQGIDQETARNIAGLGAELQQEADQMTAYSGGGQIGTGGMSEHGMPTGISIQGKRQYRSWMS